MWSVGVGLCENFGSEFASSWRHRGGRRWRHSRSPTSHSPKVKQRHMASNDNKPAFAIYLLRSMKHPSVTMRSAVIAACLVCLIPASVEAVDIVDADTTQTDAHPATSTNDFSATKGTDTVANVDQRTKSLDGGLNPYNNDAADMREDEEYWDRLLQTMEGSLPNAASEASSTEIQDEDECPSRVVGVQCPGCQPIGEDCVLEVDMTHTVVNSGDAAVRIYELNAIRNRGKVNLYDLIPSDAIDMQPGSQIQVVERVEINQCEGDTFETETQLIVGPPADVVVNISCLQENGGDCRSISQPETTEGCQEDVLYTYRVVNTGAVDANIITLERTRNGEIRDLLPLLDSNPLAAGVMTSVEETDRIDICTGDVYSTQLLVQQVPKNDLLCESTATYSDQNK